MSKNKKPVVAESSLSNERQKEEARKKFHFFLTQVRFLEGKLLTVVDASYSDREQREAIKSLVKKEVRNWSDWVHQLIIHAVAPSEDGGIPPSSSPEAI